MRGAQPARILGYAALSGFRDFGGTYTIWSWLFGLCLRMLAQVAFFASLGRLLGSDDQVEFLLVGNAVMVAASASLTVAVATTWERGAGTLPLLVASPTSPLLVLMARSVWFIANGVITSLGAFLVVAPLFDVGLPLARVPALVALDLLVAASMYGAGAFLGGVVLRAPGTRRTIANVARMTVMAFCGVSVPRDYFPEAVQRVSDVLPLAHGLDAVRELFGPARTGQILEAAALELAVGCLWLALAAATFGWLANAGRRDGSIVFSSI